MVFGAAHWLASFGIKSCDSLGVRARKKGAAVSAAGVCILSLVLICCFISIRWSHRFQLPDALLILYFGITAIIHFIAYVLYCITKLDHHIRYCVALCGLAFAPILYTANSCDVTRTSGDCILCCFPMLCLWTMTGGGRLGFRLLLSLSALAILACYVPYFIRLDPSQFCPAKQDHAYQMVLSAVLTTGALFFSSYCFLQILAQADRREEKLRSDANLIARITELISNMDLDGADEVLRSETSHEHEHLFTIVNNLRSFAPFMPDYIFYRESAISPRAPAQSNPETPMVPFGATPTSKDGLHDQIVAAEKTSPRSPFSVVATPLFPFTPLVSSPARPSPTFPLGRLLNSVLPESFCSSTSSMHRQDDTCVETAAETSSATETATVPNVSFTPRTVAPPHILHLRKGLTSRSVTVLSIGLVELHNEFHSPDRLYTLLQNFLDVALPLIKQRGTLLSFGSGHIVGVWNAVSPCGSHVQRACQCALQISSGLGALGLRSRTAIVTDTMNCGTIGVDHTSFNILGSAMVMAEGLQRLNSQLGTSILLAPSTAAEAVAFRTRIVDVVKFEYPADIAGVSMHIRELLSENVSTEEAEWMYQLQQSCNLDPYVDYHTAYDMMLEGDSARALEVFERFAFENPDDEVTNRLIKRLRSVAPNEPSQASRTIKAVPWTPYEGEIAVTSL
eukprot:NODE_736_length_2139_cov_35.471726_g702_i0.p1 GENE.NODE_736_length_2139_cov_35.471726_g702_i0~~NODE_736_length_2139_cov_35.471726_g702_i0.p1  ORF type:complete len:696 (+),score=84.08 NODE_736_length_2139_cov_35.471726_g702_i0:52-2088(+)